MNRFRLLATGMVIFGVGHAAQPAAPTPAAPASAAPKPVYELTLVDMQGQKKMLGTMSPVVFAPRVAPDGKRVAFEGAEPPAPGDPQLTQIFVADLDKLDKKKALQQTVAARQDIAPVWSPDGDWIAFLATGNGDDTLYHEHSDSNFQPKYLVDGRAVEGLYRGGTLDGGLMVFLTLKGDRDYGISMLDIYTQKVTRLVDLPGSGQHSSEISPNGKWLAYVSNETGREEVWLEPMPQTGKRFQITRNGGAHPEWSPDGTKIYIDQAGQIFQLNITVGGDAPKAGDPVALPIKGFLQSDLRRQYDLMPDGKGFVMLFPASTTAPVTK